MMYIGNKEVTEIFLGELKVYGTEHPATTAWLAEISSKGYTPPTQTQIIAINNFIEGLDSNGLLVRMITGNIYGFGSFGAGTLNIKNPATYQHTAIGTPVFTEGKGVKSAGAGSAINTKFKVNEYAGIENDLTTIVITNDNSEAISGIAFGSRMTSTSTAIRYSLQPIQAPLTGARFNYNLNTQPFTSNNVRGIYTHVQENGKSIVYKDGLKKESVVTTVAPDISNEVVLLGYNSHAGGGVTVTSPFTQNVIGFFRFDHFSQIDVDIFNDLWIIFEKAVATPKTLFVRPTGTTYGTGDGTSYANAWSGFSAINWGALNAWDTLYVCGNHSETLNVGASNFYLRGDYTTDMAVINVASSSDVCIRVQGKSYIELFGFEISYAVISCFDALSNSVNIIVNNMYAHHSGNQAFQNQQESKVTYNNCIGAHSYDDGLSLHNSVVVEANNCEFHDNGQGVNGISTSIFVANNCNFHDNIVNIQPDNSCDITINNSQITNGKIWGNSTVPAKINNCVLVSAPLEGNVIVTP